MLRGPEVVGDEIDGVAVILDEQDCVASNRSQGSFDNARGRSAAARGDHLDGGQGHREAAPFAEGGLEIEPATVRLDQATGEGQAQSRPLLMLGWVSDLGELLEDPREVLLCDAHPGVADGHVDLTGLIASRLDADAPTVRGVLDRVREEVVEDLAEPARILYNLLSNAIKYTPDGGSIRVE